MRPLASLLTGRELARVMARHAATYPRDPDLSRADYALELHDVAALMYPDKVTD